MKKRIVNLGDTFGKLTIIAFERSDPRGNRMVRVRCSCPDHTEKVVRLSGLTFEPYSDRQGKWRSPYRSCGCESKRAYREHLEDRVKKLVKRLGRRRGKRFLRKIWQRYQRGNTIEEIAARQRLEAPLILEAVRLFNKTHPNPVGGAIPRGTKAYGEWMSRDEDMNKDLE